MYNRWQHISAYSGGAGEESRFWARDAIPSVKMPGEPMRGQGQSNSGPVGHADLGRRISATRLLRPVRIDITADTARNICKMRWGREQEFVPNSRIARHLG